MIDEHRHAGNNMRSITFLIALCLIMVTTGTAFITDMASAAESGTDTISSGGHIVYEFKSSSKISLNYNIKVLSGPNIDVLLVDENGFNQYNNMGLFSGMYYKPTYSKLDTRNAYYSGEISSGHYYLIIDNSWVGDASPGGRDVTISYSIDAKPIGSSSIIALILIGVLFLIFLIVIVSIVSNRKNKQRLQNTAPIFPAQYSQPMTNNQAFCPQCGSAIDKQYRFCPRCGTEITQPRKIKVQ